MNSMVEQFNLEKQGLINVLNDFQFNSDEDFVVCRNRLSCLNSLLTATASMAGAAFESVYNDSIRQAIRGYFVKKLKEYPHRYKQNGSWYDYQLAFDCNDMLAPYQIKEAWEYIQGHHSDFGGYKNALEEYIMNLYDSYVGDEKRRVCADLTESCLEVHTLQKYIGDSLIWEEFQDLVCVSPPYDFIMNQKILVDVLVEDSRYPNDIGQGRKGVVGDHGYYEMQNTPLGKHSSIAWLLKEHGIPYDLANRVVHDALTESDRDKLKKVSLKDGLYRDIFDTFVREVSNEVYEIDPTDTCLTFLCNTTIGKLVNALDDMESMEKGTPYSLKIDRGTTCGLFNQYNGSGSLMGIETLYAVRVPGHMIYKIIPDCALTYPVKEVYGCTDKLWGKPQSMFLIEKH